MYIQVFMGTISISEYQTMFNKCKQNTVLKNRNKNLPRSLQFKVSPNLRYFLFQFYKQMIKVNGVMDMFKDVKIIFASNRVIKIKFNWG